LLSVFSCNLWCELFFPFLTSKSCICVGCTDGYHVFIKLKLLKEVQHIRGQKNWSFSTQVYKLLR
jgi:hypothetical protein